MINYPDKFELSDTNSITMTKLNQIIDAGIGTQESINIIPGVITHPANNSVNVMTTTIDIQPSSLAINDDSIDISTYWLTDDVEGKNIVYGPYNESGSNSHPLNMDEITPEETYYAWAYQVTTKGFKSSNFGGNKFTMSSVFEVINTPVITSPTDGATDLTMVTVLMDPPVVEEGGIPSHTKTQIEMSSGGVVVNTVTVTENLLSVPLPVDGEKTYVIRARFYDSVRGWSNWSSLIMFSTAATPKTLDRPTVTGPENGVTIGIVTLDPPVVEEGGTPSHTKTEVELRRLALVNGELQRIYLRTVSVTENLLSVPLGDLNSEEDYQVNARFYDSVRGWSEWSGNYYFTTGEIIGHGVRIDGGIAIGPYSFADGKTGYLVVAPGSERDTSERFGVYDVDTTLPNITSAVTKDTNTGAQNTNVLTSAAYNSYVSPYSNVVGARAAEWCENHTFEGFSDYFLPNKEELDFIYQNKNVIDAADESSSGKFSSVTLSVTIMWSSSEYNNAFMWSQTIMDGNQKNTLDKNSFGWAIPCRRVLA